MKKARKGLTLVEIVVAIAVFSIISLALISANVGLVRVVSRQEEYTRLDMASHDMMAFYDAYGVDWAEKYFSKNGEIFVVGGEYGFLNKDFLPCSESDANKKYTIHFKTEIGELDIISIKSESFVYVED